MFQKQQIALLGREKPGFSPENINAIALAGEVMRTEKSTR